MHMAGASPAEPVEGPVSYLALILPGGWLLVLVAVLADGAGPDPLTTVWLAFGALLCLAAVVVIIGRRSRRGWAWSIGAIPASFLGPVAFALLLVPAIRQDLRAARVPRPRFQPGRPAVQASGIEEPRRKRWRGARLGLYRADASPTADLHRPCSASSACSWRA